MKISYNKFIHFYSLGTPQHNQLDEDQLKYLHQLITITPEKFFHVLEAMILAMKIPDELTSDEVIRKIKQKVAIDNELKEIRKAMGND